MISILQIRSKRKITKISSFNHWIRTPNSWNFIHFGRIVLLSKMYLFEQCSISTSIRYNKNIKLDMTKKILEINSTKRKYTRQLRINQSTILWINCVHRDRKIDCVCEHIDFRWKTDGACRAQLACVCVVLCLCFAPHSYRRHGIHQADEITAAATATHSFRLIYSYTFVLSVFNLCWALFHFIVIEIYTRSSTTNTHVLCSVLTQTTITDKCGSSSWHYIVLYCIVLGMWFAFGITINGNVKILWMYGIIVLDTRCTSSILDEQLKLCAHNIWLLTVPYKRTTHMVRSKCMAYTSTPNVCGIVSHQTTFCVYFLVLKMRNSGTHIPSATFTVFNCHGATAYMLLELVRILDFRLPSADGIKCNTQFCYIQRCYMLQ